MSGTHRSPATAVFVDQSGRRRRILMIAGVLLGTLMLAMAAMLIGGAFSTTKLDAVDWPDGGTGVPEKSVPAVAKSSASPSPTARPTRPVMPVASATPTPSRTATPTRSQTQVARQSTSPDATPDAGTPTADPSTSASPETESGRNPPGQTKEPPGLGSDKSHGPKQ